MFISYSNENNTVQTMHETEWQCRLRAKGLSKIEYWAWIDTITTQDENGMDVITYPSEDFTIVECKDEDIDARLEQLSLGGYLGVGGVYNITWSDSKDTFVMTTDIDGNSVKAVESVEPEELDEDPDSDTFGDVIKEEKTNYKMSHFEGQDDTRDARILAEKWETVRVQRNRVIAETDYHALSDQTLSGDMETYREDLRDVPTQSDPDNISWPIKPS